MFDCKTESKSYQIGKYVVGGDPRQVPTALAGTIFYKGQKKIFRNELKGQINKKYAETLIKKQEELADKTGLTPLLDVVITYEESIKPILDFVLNLATDTPILVDAPVWDVKRPLLNYLMETGQDRKIIYNSITSSSYDEEFELLSRTNIEYFFLLPIESCFWTTKARLDVADQLIGKTKERLKKDKFLIDTCVIDFTSLGLAMSAMHEIKCKYGYPVGTAGQNLADAWKNLVPKFGEIKDYVKVTASTFPLAAGADFIFYGPIQSANLVFPNVAFVKAAQSQLLFDEGKIAPPDHPVFKIN